MILSPAKPLALAIIFALATLTHTQRAGAQESPTAPEKTSADTPPAKKPAVSPQTVQKIEVTGQKNTNEDRRVSTASKIIISREDIEQYGDSNLGDVMRRLPGVSQGGRPGRGGPIAMRGMGGGFTQILINGERIAPGFSVEQISPEQVERIEILRAPTAETGARAVAGTINIILREPLRTLNNDLRGGVTSDRGKLSGNATVSRNNTLGPTSTYNLTLTANHNDQLTDTLAHTTYFDTLANRLDRVQDTFSQNHAVNDSVFLTSRFQWRLGPGETFSIQPFLVKNKPTNSTKGTLTQSLGNVPAPYATSTAEFDGNFQAARVMTNLNKRIDQDTRYELRLSGGRLASDTDLLLEQFNTTGGRTLIQSTIADVKDVSWNTGGKITRNWGDAKHAFVAGWELESVKRQENSVTLLNGVTQLQDFGTELDISTFRRAAYVQDEWDPVPEWGSYLGVRWETIETKSDVAGGTVRNLSRVVTPLAHSVWRFASPSRDQIRLSLTQSYRAPATQQLVARPFLNTFFPVPGPNTSITPDRAGNPSLKPELANGIDLAYENYLKAGGVVTVNFFNRRIRDLIRSTTRLETVSWANSPRFVSRPQNLGKATTRGIEFDAKFQLPELIDGAIPLSVKANLSLYRSHVDEVPGPNNRIDQQPRATGNLGVDYRFRGTPLTLGGTLAFTPGYETQQTDVQSQSVNIKRSLDMYALWVFDSTTRLRLTVANLVPRDSVTTNTIFDGSLRESVISNGRTHQAITLRLELKL